MIEKPLDFPPSVPRHGSESSEVDEGRELAPVLPLDGAFQQGRRTSPGSPLLGTYGRPTWLWIIRLGLLGLLFALLLYLVDLAVSFTVDLSDEYLIQQSLQQSNFRPLALEGGLSGEPERSRGTSRQSAAAPGEPVRLTTGLMLSILGPEGPGAELPPPPPGYRQLRLQVQLDASGRTPSSLLLMESDFKLVGAAGGSYGKACASESPVEGRLNLSVRGERLLVGEICRLVPDREPMSYLLYDSILEGAPRYFQLPAGVGG